MKCSFLVPSLPRLGIRLFHPCRLAVWFFFLASLSLGCATKIYNSSSSGPSTDIQEVLARSIEEAFSAIPEEVWGCRISLHITPPPATGDGLSAYLAQHLRELIARKGGSLEPPYDLYLTVIVPASGSLITERRLSLTVNIGGVGNIRIPLFYGESFKGMTRTLILCQDEEGRVFRVLHGEQKRASHEIYWFWFLGPFESEALPQL